MTFKLKRFFIAVFTFFLINSAFSQYNETIRTGRPGQAIGPFTVGARVFQIQAGLDYAEISKNEYLLSQTLFGGSVFRMGLTEHFELGASVAYLNDKRYDATTLNGIAVLSLAMRNNIYVGKGLIPSVGVQLNIGLPYLSKDYNSEYIRPRITVMTAQRMGSKLGFITNWGGYWNGNDARPIGFYVLNLSYDITAKWSVFIEHFATIINGDWRGNVDGGAAFLVNNDLQLDLSAGYGQNETINKDWFVSMGLSWRVRFIDKKEL
jgi:hypothetical protein